MDPKVYFTNQEKQNLFVVKYYNPIQFCEHTTDKTKLCSKGSKFYIMQKNVFLHFKTLLSYPI